MLRSKASNRNRCPHKRVSSNRHLFGRLRREQPHGCDGPVACTERSKRSTYPTRDTSAGQMGQRERTSFCERRRYSGREQSDRNRYPQTGNSVPYLMRRSDDRFGARLSATARSNPKQQRSIIGWEPGSFGRCPGERRCRVSLPKLLSGPSIRSVCCPKSVCRSVACSRLRLGCEVPAA